VHWVVPATVQAILAARIDRLPPEDKRLLQSASVIGESVPFTLLQAVVEMPEEELHSHLGRLQSVEFLYETGLFPDLEYTFKHGLTYQVAYNSLLVDRRRSLHAKILDTIERLYADRPAEQVDRLAHHAIRGEMWEKAVTYLHQAGAKAAARSAYREAVAYFEQALSALEHLPETREMIELGIAIRVDLGPALINTRGWKGPELEQTYTRARELCQQLGETTQLFPVLWGLSRLYNWRGEIQTARELGEQLFTLAQREQDPALLLEAHHTLWAYAFFLGELDSALEHQQQGIALYDPQQHRHLASLYAGHDPAVCSLVVASRVLWLQGYPDQALQKTKDTLALAREVSHPYSLVFALVGSASVHVQRKEIEALREGLEAGLTLATDQGFPRMIAQFKVLQGWLLAEQGNKEEGIAQILEGKTTIEDHMQSYFAALLADSYLKTGQTEKGLNTVNETLARVHKTGLKFYEAELDRIKGELLQMQEGKNQKAKGKSEEGLEAESCFQQAIKLSQQQGAKSLELRAVMSLSRLRQEQGKKKAAHQLLAEVYGWFTEGFDTADLKEAKALLEELS